MHLLCDAIKIFEELTLEKLELDINKVYEKKKVKDASIKLLASDEYKELLSRVEAKYSSPDGGEKL